MTRLILVAICMVSLAGCVPNSLAKAKQDFICKDRGGVYKYVGTRAQKVTCRDASLQEWTDTLLPEEFYPTVKDRHGSRP